MKQPDWAEREKENIIMSKFKMKKYDFMV